MSVRIAVEIDERKLRELVLTHLREVVGIGIPLDEDDVLIEVKSTRNYRAEWERAAFRARVEKFA